MMDWIQKYWQLLFVGTISYIGGLAAPTLVKIIDEALTKIFRIISEKSFKEIISSLKKFNGWVNFKLKIIKYNLLSNHSFTEDEYNIYKKLKDKKTLTKNEKDILNYMESNDEIFINIIIREINNKPIKHDYLNYDASVKCDENESFHM
jgi:phenylalanyl-tRNA synthetase alpha subunit